MNVADLIMAAEIGEVAVPAPFDAVRTGLPEEQAPARVHPVFGHQMKETLFREVPRLWIRELLGFDKLELFDIVGTFAPVDKTRTPGHATADEYPDVAVAVDRQARVVMGVIDAAPVMHHGRTRHAVVFVVVIRNHREEVAASGNRSSINEKRFVHLRRVNGQRNMIGRVGAKTAGILVPVFRELPEGVPDSPIPVVLPGNVRLMVQIRRRLFVGVETETGEVGGKIILRFCEEIMIDGDGSGFCLDADFDRARGNG